MSLKSDLIRRVARKNPSLGEAIVSQIFSIFFMAIVNSVRDGDRVELRGFGSFSSRHYVLKNGSSGLGLSKSRYKRMYFRPSDKLIKAVNSSGSRESS